MDLSIRLHPDASDLLFKYFRPISRIFGDVIGQMEIDYISIALISGRGELLFFSSRPGTEWSMIENDFWMSDQRFQQDFMMQDKALPWTQSTKPSQYAMGICVPSTFEGYRVVYTFATKSNHPKVHAHISTHLDMLVHLGQFCLKRILDIIPLPIGLSCKKPKLHLVINNTGV